MSNVRATIYVAVDHGNRLDWFDAGVVTVPLIGGIMLVLAAIACQLASPSPFAHPRAVMGRNTWVPLSIVALFGTTSLSTAFIIPGFLFTMDQLKVTQAADAVWVVSVVQVLAVPLGIWLLRRFDPRLPLVIGLLSLLTGCWLGSFLTNVWRAEDFTIVAAILGFGNGITFLTLVVTTIANARRENVVAMVAYIQIPRILGPEVAGAVLATLLRKREGFHSSMLTSYLEQAKLASLGGTTRYLAPIVRREAFVLAYADLYRYCFLAALLGLALASLLRRTPPNPLTARYGADRS